MQMLNENGDVGINADRSFTSRFWGTMAKTFVTTASRFKAPWKEALRLVLPLPAVSTESFTGPAQPEPSERAVESGTQPSSHLDGSAEIAKLNKVFILKEVDQGLKRKAEEAQLDSIVISSPVASGLDAGPDYSPLGKPNVDTAAARAESKARGKDEKRQKEALKEETNHDIPTEPFDYANAESILHAKSDRSQPNGSARVQRQFNPYVKALDGPQGIKRVRKETAGKSFTFKK